MEARAGVRPLRRGGDGGRAGSGGGDVLELAGVLGVQSARLTVLALDRLVHLLAVYADLDRGRDPQSDLVAPDIHHGDDDVIADDDAFVAVSGQDQHLVRLLPPANVRCGPVDRP